MPQKLLLPFRRPVLSSAYLHPLYAKTWGCPHYGWDMGADESGYTVLSPGEGTVLDAGMDGTTRKGAGSGLGLCAVIIFRDVLLNTGEVTNLACRMFHMDSFAIKPGDRIIPGQKLGEYGDTGGKLLKDGGWGRHFHIEFDTDISYPRHAYGIAASGRILRKGTMDSTVNPRAVFWRKDGQSIRGCKARDGNDWFTDKDIYLPVIGVGTCPTCGKEI